MSTQRHDPCNSCKHVCFADVPFLLRSGGGGDSQRISSFIWNHFLLAGGVDLAFTLLAAPTSCLFVAQLEQVDKYSRVHHQVR